MFTNAIKERVEQWDAFFEAYSNSPDEEGATEELAAVSDLYKKTDEEFNTFRSAIDVLFQFNDENKIIGTNAKVQLQNEQNHGVDSDSDTEYSSSQDDSEVSEQELNELKSSVLSVFAANINELKSYRQKNNFPGISTQINSPKSSKKFLFGSSKHYSSDDFVNDQNVKIGPMNQSDEQVAVSDPFSCKEDEDCKPQNGFKISSTPKPKQLQKTKVRQLQDLSSVEEMEENQINNVSAETMQLDHFFKHAGSDQFYSPPKNARNSILSQNLEFYSPSKLKSKDDHKTCSVSNLTCTNPFSVLIEKCVSPKRKLCPSGDRVSLNSVCEARRISPSKPPDELSSSHSVTTPSIKKEDFSVNEARRFSLLQGPSRPSSSRRMRRKSSVFTNKLEILEDLTSFDISENVPEILEPDFKETGCCKVNSSALPSESSGELSSLNSVATSSTVKEDLCGDLYKTKDGLLNFIPTKTDLTSREKKKDVNVGTLLTEFNPEDIVVISSAKSKKSKKSYKRVKELSLL